MDDQPITDQAPTPTLPKGPSTEDQGNTVQVPKGTGYDVGPVGTRGSFEVIADSPDFCTLRISKEEAGEAGPMDDGSMDSAVNSVDAMFASKKGSY